MSVLKDAHALIKSGDKTGARTLLEPYLAEKPDSANGWWLMANTVDDVDQQRRYLRRALDANPDHELARNKLADLSGVGDFGFGDDDDEPVDFNYMTADQADYPKPKNDQKKNSGSRTLWIVLGSIFACMCVGTVGIIGTLALLGPAIEDTFDEMIAEIEAELGTPGAASYTVQGSISTGQVVNGTVDVFGDDGWTYQGQAGQSITIEARETDGNMDTVVTLYGPSGSYIDENDDGLAGCCNSLLTVTLPETGEYVIVVGGFSGGGDYELIVR